MKNKYSYLIVFFAIVCITTFFSGKALAQTRYLDIVFPDVSVTSDVVYGNNLSVMSGGPIPFDLKMDVYEPSGDIETNRPVVIVMHTGNFLPAVYNGSPTGTKTDKAIVELCEQFSRRGYVAIAMTYRQGWDPLNTVEAIRTGSIMNAAYRAVQDAHTCVRYLRMDVTLNGNTFGIDTSKFVIGGVGTGGYVSLGFDAFDDYAELEFPKFMDFTTDPLNPVPYIDTAESGDFNGEWARPLNTPSHTGYSNNANMIFNIGGAMGDSSWMTAGDLPIMSFHCINDPNAPYHYGAVIVPTTGGFVLDASGGHSVVWNANNFGNNDAFATEIYTDCFSVRANSINDGIKGLFPFQTPAPGSMTCTDGAGETEQGSPWDWWDEAVYIATANAVGKDGDIENCHALLSNPDMSEYKGKAYADTIVGYLLPRMHKVLFGTYIDGVCYVGIDGSEGPSKLSIYPNPSADHITLSTEEIIRTVSLHDISGRLIYERTSINAKEFVLSKLGINTGMYFAKVTTDYGHVSTKIIFK